jgi:hypothetical protein
LEFVGRLFGNFCRVSFLFVKIDMRNDSSADHVVVFVNQSLSQELLDVLEVLLLNNLGENSESICLEDIVIGELDVLEETRDDNEDFVFADVQFLQQKLSIKSCQPLTLISTYTSLRKF